MEYFWITNRFFFPYQQCTTVEEQQCSTVNEQQCQTINEQECNTVQEEQCTQTFEEECATTTDQECTTVEEQVRRFSNSMHFHENGKIYLCLFCFLCSNVKP